MYLKIEMYAIELKSIMQHLTGGCEEKKMLCASLLKRTDVATFGVKY